MSTSGAAERLSAALPGRVLVDEPLSRHTTYRVGGPADLYITCDTLEDLDLALTVLSDEGVDTTVLGGGSNVLAADAGYRGAVLSLGAGFRGIRVDGSRMIVGAGASLAAVVRRAADEGLSGLEFAVGIPGSLGGALAMNAGSREEWIGTAVERMRYRLRSGGLRDVSGSDVDWGYRRCSVAGEGVLTEATLLLNPADKTEIASSMAQRLERRRKTQPLDLPNAGSVFINPSGDSAGRLVEAAGLKGASVGGASVSRLHANFIVNTGDATARDIVALIDSVRTTVKERYGVELTPEIRILGIIESA